MTEPNNRQTDYHVGMMYFQGNGVERDYTEALRLLKLSAAGGYDKAQYQLGLSYKSGIGVNQDYMEALDWFKEASEQHNADALFAIGELYEFGHGVQADNEESLKWYALAAKYGNAQAYLKVPGLRSIKSEPQTTSNSNIDSVPNDMNPTIKSYDNRDSVNLKESSFKLICVKVIGFIIGFIAAVAFEVGIIAIMNNITHSLSTPAGIGFIAFPILCGAYCARISDTLLKIVFILWKENKFVRLIAFTWGSWVVGVYIYVLCAEPFGHRMSAGLEQMLLIMLLPPAAILTLYVIFNKFIK